MSGLQHARFAPLDRPMPATEIHMLGCDCVACEPYAPSIEQPLPLIRLTVAGIVAGHVAALLIDPVGSIAIATDLLRWWLL